MSATAFDGVAAEYDAAFTDTLLGRLLRQRVWQILGGIIRPGQRVLELGCGTGEDAIWLGQRGAKVLATDGAGQMVQIARSKVAAAGLASSVVVRQLSLQEVATDHLAKDSGLDLVFSNFGGLNTIEAWQPLARALSRRVRPGGWVLLVVMGPFCPWEIGWYLLHGRWQLARRRWHSPVEAMVGDRKIPVWYPPPARLRRDFAPWFTAHRTFSLGLLLPPSYLGHLVARAPRLFDRLDALEQAIAGLTRGWGDHYVLLLQRGRVSGE